MSQLTEEHPTFLIWDSDGEPPKGKWIPILWRSYAEGDNLVHSIPRLLEEQADALRARYLAWIYGVGESHIEGKRLVDHLELRPGFSYWWMTLVAKKSNIWESLYISDVLKLLALEELAVTHSVSAIILVSGDRSLVQALRRWCINAGLVFEWRSLSERKSPDSWIKRLYHSLPHPVQAIIWLTHYIWQRWPLKQKNGYQKAADSNAMTFVDYLIHLDQKALTTGRFASNFWTDLVDVLGRCGAQINWLHHYIQHEAVASTRQAQDLIARFNQNGMVRQFHATLDGALSISAVLATLIDYSRLVWMSMRLNKIRHQFCTTESRLDFWPLFKQDWRNSMRGPIAIWNCLCLNLFERTLRRLPHQELGVYLQENQEWEMAFIHAWRTAGHGRLIGVPHGPVRFWDLRYFYDTKSYVRAGKNDLPLPDKMALNGPAALAAYRKEGYPKDQIVEVEALRYQYLADLPPIKTGANEPLIGPLRILVLGDYLPAVTRQQMQWLVDAAPLLPLDTIYVVKPHPNCPIKTGDYSSLQLLMTSAPLKELLSECNVAYTSNITTAAVDAYYSGLQVVSVLDSNSFNMSPLRGMEGVMYATNPTELAEALLTTRDCARVVAEPYFCLDKRLPRWRRLLGIHPDDTEGPAENRRSIIAN